MVLSFFVVILFMIDRDRALEIMLGPMEIQPTEFAALILSPDPNQFLVCPENYCSVTPHMISPHYSMPVEILRQRWMALISTEPRMTTGLSDLAKNQYEFIQRSQFMHFPDSITVQFISLNNDASTVAIYSRSHWKSVV